MRVAIQNTFPNSPSTAEAEWIWRCVTACERLGFEPVEVVTSDDIMRLAPDCVLATHHFSPKLTPFPTLGLMWNPPVFIEENRAALASILSYDGYLCGSLPIARWLGDYLAGRGRLAEVHDTLMLPSTPDCGPAGPLPPDLAVMYAGVHWDGSRHEEVFRHLDGRLPMHLYGPSEAWCGRGAAYRGSLPFDGVSVIEAVRRAGIALCLHNAAHRAMECPTMRLFEAAAAGALIITDEFDFPRQWFRDSVLYVDAQLPAALVAEQILAHVAWANRNRDKAQMLARRANALFRRSLTLEGMLSGLPDFVQRVRERCAMTPVADAPQRRLPTVEYIIRVGSRPAAMVARALDCLVAQTYPSIAVTIVQFHPVPGLDALLTAYEAKFAALKHVIVANNGNRATALWAGLNRAEADFIGVLDDDDTLFPNHVATIMRGFDRDPTAGLVYSGLVRIQDEPGHYVLAPQFARPGGTVITETRELFCLEEEDFRDFTPMHNVVGLHSWIGRRALLDDEALRDPGLEYAEDVFLMARFANRAPIRFTAMATAAWHWRSTSRDNWSLSRPSDQVGAYVDRWTMRARNLRLPTHNRVPRRQPGGALHAALAEDAG